MMHRWHVRSKEQIYASLPGGSQERG